MNNIIDNFSKSSCCGCGGCAQICPKKAITMFEDEYGFVYPGVDSNLCINCGLCTKACPFKTSEKGKYLSTYLYIEKDEKKRSQSQSGGAFNALAEKIIELGGYVFGVEIDKDKNIFHSFSNDLNGIEKYKKSKYVQSDLRNTFQECADLLIDKKPVLFAGTGCQVQGLINFLSLKNIDLTNLYTCDLICHGVPSQKLWKDFSKYLEKKYKSKIKHIIFRDKSTSGWHGQVDKYEFENGKTLVGRYWTNIFCSNVYRDSCFNCKFTSVYRCSDFTIGDAWGLEKVYPNLDDNKGASIFLVHSSKGLGFIKDICDKEIDINDFLQPRLCGDNNLKRDERFLEMYKNNPDKAFKHYLFPNKFILKIKHIIKKLIK